MLDFDKSETYTDGDTNSDKEGDSDKEAYSDREANSDKEANNDKETDNNKEDNSDKEANSDNDRDEDSDITSDPYVGEDPMELSKDSPDPIPRIEATNAVLDDDAANAANAADSQPETHLVMDHMAGKYDEIYKFLEIAVPYHPPSATRPQRQNQQKRSRSSSPERPIKRRNLGDRSPTSAFLKAQQAQKAQLAAEPAVQPVIQLAAEPVVQPAVQLAPEPAVQLVAKPAAEPAMQPAVQLVAEPAMQPVVQLAAEPAMQPAVQLVAEPAVQPMQPAVQLAAKTAVQPKPAVPPKGVPDWIKRLDIANFAERINWAEYDGRRGRRYETDDE